MPYRLLAATCLALFPLSLVRADEWILTYAVTEEQRIESPKGDAPPRTETRAYTQTVALGERYLVVQDDRQKLVRDFAQRRFVVLNLARNTYHDWSLFGLVDFFEAELVNRHTLGVGMRAAKVESAAMMFDRFDSESAMRIKSRTAPADSPPPVIETVKVGQGIEFKHRGQTAVRFVAAGTPLPPNLRHRFVNYLAYGCSIHPDIRDALAATAAIPQELTFTWRQVNSETTATHRLVSAKAAKSDSTVLPEGAKPALPESDPVTDALIAVQAAERGGAKRPSQRDAIAFAESALADGRPLDGLLALLEHGLQSGEQLTDELRRHRAKFDRDAACQTYLKAFDQSSRAAAERSLAANETLDRRSLRRAYMLELQRANHLDRLGRPREAMQGYLEVIRANPFHAGALHDLGMLLARGFDHPKAWTCWDLARRLYPAHPMLRDIAAREQQLLARNPDFF